MGGGHWKFNDRSFSDRWNSQELNEFRQRTLNNEQIPACVRCFSEEAVGGYSLRREIYDVETDPSGKKTAVLGARNDRGIPIFPDLITKPMFYSKGPMQMVLKCSNVCNLRCRTCNSKDSYLFQREGHFYNNEYEVVGPVESRWYTEGPSAVEWTDEQIEEIYQFTSNLRRLEIYGGEPLIDKKTPLLLEKLVESGRSKKIDLNISTNGTRIPDDRWEETVTQFQRFNFNVSIDGLGAHFEYLRHPAKWKTVRSNIDHFLDMSSRHERFTLLPTVTISTMNIYYLPELVTELKQIFNCDPHLNLATNPHWYNIKNIPDAIKSQVVEKIRSSKISQIQPYADYMETNSCDSNSWESFKFFTKVMDDYRKENFAETFPEFYSLMENAGESINEDSLGYYKRRALLLNQSSQGR
jgi:MoaA/NifB/PqqE/SkfB family radical SAM enzyme